MCEECAFGFNNSSEWIYIDLVKDIFACSNSTIETLGEDIEYVQSNSKDSRIKKMTSFLCLYC